MRRPEIPPARLTCSKYAQAPRYYSIPSPLDGPENGADMPRIISLSVTPAPGVSAMDRNQGHVSPPTMPPPINDRLVNIPCHSPLFVLATADGAIAALFPISRTVSSLGPRICLQQKELSALFTAVLGFVVGMIVSYCK